LNINITKKEEDDNSMVVSDVTEEHLEAKTMGVADLHAEVRVKWQCMHLKNYNINMF
jgi:predicted metal-binding protein